ncbi:conserved hypothetical protein, partial [Trichinella spiralis]
MHDEKRSATFFYFVSSR